MVRGGERAGNEVEAGRTAEGEERDLGSGQRWGRGYVRQGRCTGRSSEMDKVEGW